MEKTPLFRLDIVYRDGNSERGVRLLANAPFCPNGGRQ